MRALALAVLLAGCTRQVPEPVDGGLDGGAEDAEVCFPRTCTTDLDCCPGQSCELMECGVAG